MFSSAKTSLTAVPLVIGFAGAAAAVDCVDFDVQTVQYNYQQNQSVYAASFNENLPNAFTLVSQPDWGYVGLYMDFSLVNGASPYAIQSFSAGTAEIVIDGRHAGIARIAPSGLIHAIIDPYPLLPWQDVEMQLISTWSAEPGGACDRHVSTPVTLAVGPDPTQQVNVPADICQTQSCLPIGVLQEGTGPNPTELTEPAAPVIIHLVPTQ